MGWLKYRQAGGAIAPPSTGQTTSNPRATTMRYFMDFATSLMGILLVVPAMLLAIFLIKLSAPRVSVFGHRS